MNKNEQFKQLAEKIKNKPPKKEYEYMNDDLAAMYELLPDVDKSLIKEASEYCSLGFNPTRAIQSAQMRALAEDSKDNSITLGIDGSSQISKEGYQKMLEYKVQYLMDQINLFDELNLYPENNDENGDAFYHYFENEFHERLFAMILPDFKNVKKTRVPYPDLLYCLGSTLIDLGDIESAERELHGAVTWNLTSAGTIFEYAETLKRTDIEKFFVKSISAYRVSYSAINVARAFRNFAYYYSEKKEWQNAYINLVLSSMYENNEERINAELKYIQENADIELQEVTNELLDKYAEEMEMPLGANPEVLDLLYSYADERYDKGDKKGSLEYFQYLYDLTEDEEIEKIIKQVKSGKYKK